MQTHAPREAILLLVGVIRDQRDEVAESGAALVQLVQCYQQLRDKPGIADEYAEVMAKYLTTPPPLDGTSLPTLQEACDDVLWRSWTAKSACRYTYRLVNVKREKELNEEGKLTRSMQLRFILTDLDAESEVDHRNWHARTDIRAPQVADRRSEIVAEAKAGDATFTGRWQGSGNSAYVTLKDIPDEVMAIDLSATPKLSRPSSIQRVELPLSDGGSWQVGESTGQITDVVGGPSTSKQVLAAVGMPAKPSDSLSFELHGPAGVLPTYDQIRLLDKDGKEIEISGAGSSGSDSRLSLTFNGLSKPPVRVRFELAVGKSQREIPVHLQGIKLP